LAKAEQALLRIGEKDLAEVEQRIIQVTLKDLPPVIKIDLPDLPPDLNNVTTDCYHGTSMQAAKKIQSQGFKVGSGMAYGAGIYFSVGGMSIAKGYVTKGDPCIIHAKVSWGKVAYLDDPKVSSFITGSGETRTKKALEKGYHSFLQTSKYSRSSPTIGIVLGMRGDYIRAPRIEVIELIDPHTGKRKK
jgi:hypothetical protein